MTPKERQAAEYARSTAEAERQLRRQLRAQAELEFRESIKDLSKEKKQHEMDARKRLKKKFRMSPDALRDRAIHEWLTKCEETHATAEQIFKT